MPNDQFLAAGVHIGMKQQTANMKRFIYKTRPDGLAVLNVALIEERIKTAAKFLSKYKNIMAISRKGVAHRPVVKFSEIVGGKASIGRFLPGTITNPSFRNYYEPDVVIVADPLIDKQAVKEASDLRIPIIALCDTFNETSNVDFVIPCNNKGRKAVAVILWTLAKEILKARKQIEKDEDFSAKPEEFEMAEGEIQDEPRSRERDEEGGERKGGLRRSGGMGRPGGRGGARRGGMRPAKGRFANARR
ncbi:MAG TPA: 30S ribosomal protein S2 [archaeon]|nr:30S ribosomal protein S2 [archaeon]